MNHRSLALTEDSWILKHKQKDDRSPGKKGGPARISHSGKSGEEGTAQGEGRWVHETLGDSSNPRKEQSGREMGRIDGPYSTFRGGKDRCRF